MTANRDISEYGGFYAPGIFTTPGVARAAAADLEMPVYYNESIPTQTGHLLPNDIVETAWNAVFWSSDQFAMQIKRDVARMGTLDVLAHSAGTETVVNAARLGAFKPGSTLDLRSPVYHERFVAQQAAAAHLRYSYDLPPFDIANLYAAENPILMLSGFADIPLLFRTHASTKPTR